MFCIVMMATFTANLIAFLAVDKYNPPFEDLEGLVNQNQYAFGILGGSTWNDLFQVIYYIINSNEISRHKNLFAFNNQKRFSVGPYLLLL